MCASDVHKYIDDGYYLQEEENPFLTKFARFVHPGICLDLGCGNGRNARFLTGIGWRVVGVDLNAAAIGAAESSCTHCFNTTILDLEPYRLGPYDLVVCLYVLQHLSRAERQRVMELIQQHLRPGGMLVVGVFVDDEHPGGLAELLSPMAFRVLCRHDWKVDDCGHGEYHRHTGEIAAALRWGRL